jgi:hypothetical protein
MDIEKLLTTADAFLRTVHLVEDHFDLEPRKQHLATVINYRDLQEMRAEFVRELVCLLVPYVYSPTKQAELIAILRAEGRDESAAHRNLFVRARKKFRPKHVQGQLSELILSILLQHRFKAAPLVRKAPITTNPNMERNGADAIHIAGTPSKYVLYIGEAKTYKRANGSLHIALKDAVQDVVHKHYSNYANELDLYTFEDFIPPELETLARAFLDGRDVEAEVHLVCIVCYNQDYKPTGQSKSERLKSTIDYLRIETSKFKKATVLAGVDADLVPRINYILFPVQELDTLIEAFAEELGG